MPASAPASAPAPATPPRRRGLWLGLLIVLVALAAAGGAWWFATQRGGTRPAAPAQPIFLNLDPFTVNLQPGSRNRYLHVAVTIKLSDGKTQALLSQHLPEVRSRALAVLANQDGDTLQDPEQKARLAEELRTSLQQPFGKHPAAQGISQVMFTNFMLQ